MNKEFRAAFQDSLEPRPDAPYASVVDRVSGKEFAAIADATIGGIFGMDGAAMVFSGANRLAGMRGEISRLRDSDTFDTHARGRARANIS